MEITKRQKIRFLMLMISLSLFPVTIFYMSPYLPIKSATEGIINGSLIMFGILFLVSLFFGRLWCGWLCPASGVQSVCAVIQPAAIKRKWIRFIKYPIFMLWIITIAAILYSSTIILKIEFLYETVNGVSVSSPKFYIIYYIVLVVLAILPLTLGRGAACNMFCMMAPFMVIGQTVARWVRLPRLKIIANNMNCTECKICNSVCPNSVDVSKDVKLGEIKNQECKKCMACVDACPKSVLEIKFEK